METITVIYSKIPLSDTSGKRRYSYNITDEDAKKISVDDIITASNVKSKLQITKMDGEGYSYVSSDGRLSHVQRPKWYPIKELENIEVVKDEEVGSLDFDI
jgi:hypothetical protein